MIGELGRQIFHKARPISCGMAVFLIMCIIVFSGCSSTPQDHPLLLGTPTFGVVTPGATISVSGANIPISLVDAQSNLSAYPGGYMNMTITTSPSAICNFQVTYGQPKPSTTWGITPRTADSNGMVSWRWQVDPGAHTGTWPLTLTTTLSNGKHATAKIDVVVTLAPITVQTSQSVLSSAPKGTFTIVISTAPSLLCTLVWNYGAGTPTKTYKAMADKNGTATWTWHVDRSAPAGTYTETITATLQDGESSSAPVNLTVTP